MSLRMAAILAVVAALGFIARSSAADLSKEEVTAALRTIERTAGAIAAGRYATKAQLRGPARTIAIEWAKAEPVVISRGFAIVETRFANRSVVAFERDWKVPAKARADAQEVRTNVANLLATRREYGKPASPPPSPTP